MYLLLLEYRPDMHKFATCSGRVNVKKTNKPKLTLMGFVLATRQAPEGRKQAVKRLTARVSIQIERAQPLTFPLPPHSLIHSRPLFELSSN